MKNNIISSNSKKNCDRQSNIDNLENYYIIKKNINNLK